MFDAKLEKILQSAETPEGRRPEEVGADSGARFSGHQGSTEVTPKPAKRRNLTIGYKIRIVETIKTLRTEGGSSIGAYIRKEGLYYSIVRKWELQYDRGALTGAQTKAKAKTAATNNELQKLRRKLASTEKELEKARFLIAFQKKISLMLGIDQPEIDDETLEIKSPKKPKSTA
jgi:transposase-like protein